MNPDWINKVLARAVQIEREINHIQRVAPDPIYTQMELACRFCSNVFQRNNLVIVDDPDGLFANGRVACPNCVEEKNLKRSYSDLSLDFDARTIAIIRFKGLKNIRLRYLDNRLIE